MRPTRLSVKFYAHNPQVTEPAAFIPVFQRWIQQQTVEGLLIDVADYQHVFHGPGVMLISHEGDYAYDLGEGRPGLRYILKRGPESDAPTALLTAVRRAVQAVDALEAEPALNGLRFDRRALRIAFADRLRYPNQPDAYDAARPWLEAAGETLFGARPSLHREENDPREPLTVVLQDSAHPPATAWR